ncbi:MAG: type I restriction enzyme HsdR N-terminal domain-containing protein [Lysinibacillus sp.]
MEKQLCLIREFPVIMYPEEYVRQNILKICMRYIPQTYIEVERPIYTYSKTDLKLRADIVILNEDSKPYLVIECKEPTEVLTLQVKEQVISYNDVIQAQFVAISNGHQTLIFELTADGYKQISLTSIADFLASKKYFYIPEMIIDRLDFEEAKDLDHIDLLQLEGNISPVSSDFLQGFYSELYNALLTVPYTPSNRILPIEIVEDFGYGLYGFGNGSGKGGRFDLIHRNFQVKSDYEEIIYRLTIAAAGTTSNDPTYGNRKGSTGLCVGVQKKAKNAYVLELNLDRFTLTNGKNITICHDGTGLKNVGIIERIREEYPYLLENDQIILGSLPLQSSISSIELSTLIENVIVYSRIRQIMKEEKKVKTSHFEYMGIT